MMSRFDVCEGRNRTLLFILLTQTLLLGAWTPSTRTSDDDTLSMAAVVEAVDVLAEELIARRHTKRDWEPARPISGEIQQKGGRTALALLALLEVGRSLQEPGLREALERLASNTHDGTYTLSLRIMLFARLPEKWHGHLERDVALLLSGFSGIVDGWGYRPAPQGRRFDNSTTQFAALALRDAAERGVKIPAELWLRLERRFLSSQLPDGSWDYAGEGRPRASMTAAAIATLAIIREHVHRGEYDKGPSSRVQPLERAIDRGLVWLDDHFDPAHNHGHSGHVPYYLFAIERAAHATGRTRFGNQDWLNHATRTLIKRSCSKTSDGGLRARKGNTPSTPDLALTLLFLKRGLLGNVIAESAGAPQERRPLAVATLCRHLAERLESRLGWVLLPEDEMLHSPAVIWLDLCTSPDFLDDPRSSKFLRIKDAIHRGATLLCSVPGGRGRTQVAARKFAAQFLAAQALPIQRGNPMLSEPWPVKTALPAFEVTNNVRALAVFVGSDPARLLQRGGKHADRALGFLANCCLRAHGGGAPNPSVHEDSVLVNSPDSNTSQKQLITQLAPKGRAIPEPAALDAFNERMNRSGESTCSTQSGELGLLEPDPETALVILSGTTSWTPSEEEWVALETWLQHDVPVLVETTGGQGDFGNAFAEAANARYAQPTEPFTELENLVGPSDANDLDFQRVAWTADSLRRFGVGTHAHNLERVRTGHPAPLVIARFDIMHSLLGRPASGVHGWRTPWADAFLTALLRNGASRSGSDS